MQCKVCRWLDSNCGPLELEATTLPTEPQPLPYKMFQFYPRKYGHFALTTTTSLSFNKTMTQSKATDLYIGRAIKRHKRLPLCFGYVLVLRKLRRIEPWWPNQTQNWTKWSNLSCRQGLKWSPRMIVIYFFTFLGRSVPRHRAQSFL